MKRFLAAMLAVTVLYTATIAAPLPITPGSTVMISTPSGPVPGMFLPATGDQIYLILTIPGPNGQPMQIAGTLVPFGTTPPGPQPPVPPVPPPVPSGKLWLLSINETQTQTPDQAAVLGSKAVNDWLAAKDWAWRKIDKDVVDQNGQVPADLAPWVQRGKDWVAKGNKWPYLIVHDAQGVSAYEGALPATEAAMLELLNKLGGQ